MSKIPASALLSLFQTMADEGWRYTSGAAERGNVDCSGAFVWAYRQLGQTIYHGSNRIARAHIERLRPIGEAALTPGMAVFKRRAPGAEGYALPAEYRAGGAT